MVKEREVEKYDLLIKKRPVEDSCQSATYSLFGFFGSSGKDCLEYHKAAHIDAFWEVNPLDAISETLTLVIVRPLGPLGEHLGKFFQRFSVRETLIILIRNFVCKVNFFTFPERAFLVFVHPNNFDIDGHHSRGWHSSNAYAFRI